MESLFGEGYRSVLVEAATGTGKTISAGNMISKWVARGQTVLFIAHRWELIDQAARTFRDVFGLEVGIERGAMCAGSEPVVCASVQTMRGPRLEKFPRDAFDVIVVDECHHAAARSYGNIFSHFHTARIVGVTATPDRADGRPLGGVFQKVAHRYGIAEAIDDGYLVPIRGIQVTVPGMDLSNVRERRQTKHGSRARPGETIDLLAPAGQARVAPLPAGPAARYAMDLHPTDLGKAVIDPLAVEGVVVPMLELAGDRRTVVFAVDLPHAEALAASVCAKLGAGAARVVHYKLHRDERRKIIDAHKAGEYRFLINCVLLTEGYDDPEIECVVMARPTMSRILYVQAVGRALRCFAGKVEALLLDFVGVGSKFDLVGPEDALGPALVGPVLRTTSSPKKVARARAALSNAMVVAPLGGPWFGPRAAFVTKLVQLVRGAREAKKKIGGWFARLLGTLRS